MPLGWGLRPPCPLGVGVGPWHSGVGVSAYPCPPGPVGLRERQIQAEEASLQELRGGHPGRSEGELRPLPADTPLTLSGLGAGSHRNRPSCKSPHCQTDPQRPPIPEVQWSPVMGREVRRDGGEEVSEKGSGGGAGGRVTLGGGQLPGAPASVPGCGVPWVGPADAPAWKFYRVYSFLDYIMGGCQIHFTVSAQDPAPRPAGRTWGPPHPGWGGQA